MGHGEPHTSPGGVVSDRDREIKYWDTEWKGRISAEGIQMNLEKLAKVVYNLAIRSHYYKIEKLDIGCGTGIHASILNWWSSGWRKKWTGIDLSQSAIKSAQGRGLNAICGDFLTAEMPQKYECFLLLDSLEHFQNKGLLAERIRRCAAKEFWVFMNVPMYAQVHEHELPMSGRDLVKFVKACGWKEHLFSMHEIYGSFGYPYMWMEVRCES